MQQRKAALRLGVVEGLEGSDKVLVLRGPFKHHGQTAPRVVRSPNAMLLQQRLDLPPPQVQLHRLVPLPLSLRHPSDLHSPAPQDLSRHAITVARGASPL